MQSKFIALLATAILVGGSFAAPEARSADPCPRAMQDLREAEADLARWYSNHCPTGHCTNPGPYGQYLMSRYEQALNRMRQACY